LTNLYLFATCGFLRERRVLGSSSKVRRSYETPLQIAAGTRCQIEQSEGEWGQMELRRLSFQPRVGGIIVLMSGILHLFANAAVAGASFGFEQVRAKAQALSQAAFEPPASQVPENLQKLDYSQYQAIHFKRGNALWAGEKLPFEIEFFLPGFLHKQIVVIHEVSDQGERPVPFDPEAFVTGTNRIDLSAPGLNYAGFRIVHTVGRIEEVGSFLDASYFRMAGRGEVFGTSARGLALNTTQLNQEEFPVFREFWLRKPQARDAALTLWAMLDSPSVAGAFEFVVTPGVNARTQTTAAFYPRKEITEFGIAPITSMFFYDENNHPAYHDFRPAVHDSDGLLLHTGKGEWIWRPLANGKMARLNSHEDLDLKGFGLMQSDHVFDHYQDLVARFELRPNVWIQPSTNWGPGRVQLVQLPTDQEFMDNVVAFWVPAHPPKPGQALDLAYDIHWSTNQPLPSSIGFVRATRIGQVAQKKHPSNLRFVVDFDGPLLRSLSAHETLEADAHCSSGAEIVNKTVVKNDVNNTWRLALEITAPAKAVDLDARLLREQKALTETWAFTWQP
jgi:glucans biosynthesis protein